MAFTPRPDLVPSSCADCEAEIIEGSHNGVGVFWATHKDHTNALTSGTEAANWITAQHAEPSVPLRHGLTGTMGDGAIDFEGVPT